MKKTIAVAILILMAGGALAQEPAKKEKAKTGNGVTVELAKPIAVDAEFSEALDDLKIINAEIARIENAQGMVEIPNSISALRARAEIKGKRLQKWMKDKGVEGWNFNAQAAQFEPPPAPAAPKKEEKAGDKK